MSRLAIPFIVIAFFAIGSIRLGPVRWRDVTPEIRLEAHSNATAIRLEMMDLHFKVRAAEDTIMRTWHDLRYR